MFQKSLLEWIRTPIKSIVLIIIFSTAFLALCFAVNYHNYVQKSISEIDKSFTTIAVPDTQTIDDFLPDTSQAGNGDLMAGFTSEADFYLSLRRFTEASKNGKLATGELLRGVCKDVTPVLSGAFDPLEYDSDIDSPRNSAAFIITVLDVEYIPKADLVRGIVNSGGGLAENAHYIIKFRVDETIALNRCYQAPEFIYAHAGAFTRELQCPFEYGKQYFISGLYYGINVITKERDNGTPFPDTYSDFDENSVPSIYLDGSDFNPTTYNVIGKETPEIKEFKVNSETTTAYTFSEDELSLMCVAYDGDLESLLSERPDIAQRLECAKVNANSIEIRTTGNLSSVLCFNQGKAEVMAGRSFTETEIASGAPVCIVSERFATYNNLKVGDSLSVDLYSTLMRRYNGGAWLMEPYTDSSDPRLQDMVQSRGSLELKIVGIYITPAWEPNAYSLNDNTVFIPSNTVPVKLNEALPENTEDLDKTERFYFARYSHHMIASLFSVIIPNDKLDEFKTEADEAGFGDYFIYNDQGYSQIKDTLPLIADSTRVFLMAALAGFLSVFVLYLALLPRKRHEFGMLISLGAKRYDAVLSIVFGWFIIIFPALFLCTIAIMLSGAPLAQTAINSTMKQLQYNDTFSVGSQESTIDLSQKFGSWTNDYATNILLILAILILYLVTAMLYYIWQSKQSTLKLLRRKE